MIAVIAALIVGFLAGVCLCVLLTQSKLAAAAAAAAAGREQARRVKAEAEVEHLMRMYEVRPLREADEL